jgi:hypothetical protein
MMPEMQCRDLVRDDSFPLCQSQLRAERTNLPILTNLIFFTQLVNSLLKLICVIAKFTFTFHFLPVCYLPAQMKMYNIVLLLIWGSYGGYDTVQSVRRSPTYKHSSSILRYRYVNRCSACDGWMSASLKVGRNNKCSRWKTTEFLFRITVLLGVSGP